MKNSFIIMFLTISQFISGQINFDQLVPPHPNVASIMKPVVTPVSKYAGIPNVGIPLYTIIQDGVEIPLSIDYHAGGIKLGEESGNVGLGWSLQAGGIITRTVNGMDDFRIDNRSYLNIDEPLPDFSLQPAAAYTSNQRYILANNECEFRVNGTGRKYSLPEPGLDQKDHMPDEFNYNVAGRSGTFYLNKNGSIYKKEKDGVIISYEFVGRDNNYIKVKFKLIFEDGTMYHFETSGTTQVVFDSSSKFENTWYLSQVSTKNKRDIIFNYEKREQIQPFRTFIQDFLDPETKPDDLCLGYSAVSCDGKGFRNYEGPQSLVDGIYLTSIEFSNGLVSFIYSEKDERLDIPFSYFLQEISITNSAEEIEEFKLNYSYFGNHRKVESGLNKGDYYGIFTVNGFNPSQTLRLRLDSIIKNDELEHSFEYYAPNDVPSKTSLSQDYWGFYNGIFNTNYFIPRTSRLTQIPLSRTANRLPSSTNAKIFSLRRITYPTKGFTDFEYELNTFTAQSSVSLPAPATVEIEKYAIANNQIEFVESAPFSPNPVGKLQVDFQFAIYGTSIKPSKSGRYSKGPFNFIEDAYLELVNADTQKVIWFQTFHSEDSPQQFEENGRAFYSYQLEQDNFQNAGSYILRAYFKDYEDTYFGQAKIAMTWHEEKVEGKDYSIGGGIRIKSITDFTKSGNIVRKQNYNYHFTEWESGKEIEKSYGKIKTLPNYDIDKATIYRLVDVNPLGMNSAYVPIKNAKVVASASSTNTFSKDIGSYVGYDQVEVELENLQKKTNGKTIYKYYNFQDVFNVYEAGSLGDIDDYYRYPAVRLPHNGLLKETEVYKVDKSNTPILLEKTINQYTINNSNASTYDLYDLFSNNDYLISGIKEYFNPIIGFRSCVGLRFQFYPYFSNRVQKIADTKIVFDQNGVNPITTTQETFYDNAVHYLPTRTEVTNSKGDTIKTQTWYPDDIDSSISLPGGSFQNYTAINLLKYNGKYPRIGQPIQTLQTVNGKDLLQRYEMFDWGEGIVNLKRQQFLKGIISTQNMLQDQFIVKRYDIHGNPLEIVKNEGVTTCYIWGYNKNSIIAIIENSNLSDIAKALAVSTSILEDFNEKNMLELNSLRIKLPHAMVTTFEYKSLVGLTRQTDPKNTTTVYEYDHLNRLKIVRDSNRDLVQDVFYNYKK